MLICTILTRVFRFIRLMVTSIVALFKPVKKSSSSEESCSLDIETGMLAQHASDMEEIEIESSTVIDIRRRSDPTPNNPERSELYERRLSRRVSVHPVKSRIIDATSKNVRDRRFSVLKSVVITSSTTTTATAIPCSVKVEFLPELPLQGLSPLSSALKVLKSSKNRVVQFVLTPTILADAEISSRASHVGASSIEDLFDLFPSPPLHLPIQAAASALNSVADPSAHEHLSAVVLPTQHPEDCFTSTIRPDSLFFSMEASPPLYSFYTGSPFQLTCDLLPTSSRIASVPATERSILVYDIPDFDASMEKLSVSCRGELPNDSEITVSSVLMTHAIDEATSSCALVSSEVSSNGSPPVSTHSLSADAGETEIDGITLDTRNTSTRSEVQLRAIDSGSCTDDVHPLSWRQSMEKILQAFQDTTTPEDQDFGDQSSSASCRGIRSVSVDNVLDACVTPCLSGTSHTDLSCSSQLADYTRDDAMATPLSLSSVDSDMLSTPVLGSFLEPVIELVQSSPEGSLRSVHEALLRSGLPGMTHGDVVIHLGATAAAAAAAATAKDTSSSPSQDLLLRMLDRLVAMDGDINVVSSDSDLHHLPSFFTGD